MINRSLSASTLVALAFSLAALPSVSFAQTPAAPTAPAPSTPPESAPTAPVAPPVAPATTPTPDTTAAGADRPATYTVASGDTLWSISHKYDTSIRALMKANNLKKHALLHPGQVLKIPPAASTATK